MTSVEVIFLIADMDKLQELKFLPRRLYTLAIIIDAQAAITTASSFSAILI